MENDRNEDLDDALDRVRSEECNAQNHNDELNRLRDEIDDLKEVIADHRRLVRELDVVWNGKNAAPQASLCDLVSQIKKERGNISNGATLAMRLVDNLCVAMQAAYIEWKHGGGAEAAMKWIENTLDGPDLIPDPDEPHGRVAQDYFDANRIGLK